LVASWLLQGHQVEAVALFLLDHAGRFDHAAVGWANTGAIR
jgi:hypothetical protein